MILPTAVEHAALALLKSLGYEPEEDPSLRDTPKRVARAWEELLAGLQEDPAKILLVTFPAHYDEMILLSGIEFTSVCKHHLLLFTGSATVGYIPGDGRVVGLSKLARLVDCFARRLQLQERMTREIASALEEHLRPRGVGVLVRAVHQCMVCRGVRKGGAVMTTSDLRGRLREDAACRAEFLELARRQP